MTAYAVWSELPRRWRGSVSLFVRNMHLWEVKQYDSENDEDFYNRFAFRDEEVKNYWGSKRTTKKIIPMTIEELYERLKPCYKEIYLQNGKLFGRECYYGNKE